MATSNRIIPQLSSQDIARFWSKVDIRGPDACWNWTASHTRYGYGAFGIRDKWFLSSRISFFYAHPDKDQSLEVLHTCDNRACVNPRHLYCGTQQQNIQDAVVRNRIATGVRLPHCVLSDQDIRDIRAAHKKGTSQSHLSRQFGVTSGHVSQILSGKTRKHVV